MLSFVGKHLSFTQKMSVHFLYFLFKWRGVNQKICLIIYVENEISNSTPDKKKKKKKKKREREEQKKLSLVTLVTDYNKLSLLSLVARIWRKL